MSRQLRTLWPPLFSLLALVMTNSFKVDEEDIRLSEVYGGIDGKAFSDVSSIILGQTLASVVLSGAERLDAITTHVSSPIDTTWNHGGSGEKEIALLLDTKEYITAMEIHWGTKRTRTYIFFVNFTTSEGNYASIGTKTTEKATVKAPPGFQLSGFFGRAKAGIHQLGIIWTRRSAQPAQLTDTMGIGWYGKRIRNWVGPTIGTAHDSACYRLTTPYDRKWSCPAGYKVNQGLCLAQCPLAYPIECFMGCLPQNDDCALEISQKIVAIIAPVVNVATASIFGAIWIFYHQSKREFLCAANVVGVIRSLLYYLRFQQTTPSKDNVEELLAVAYQSDVVLVDLPVAITNCLGLPVPPTLVFTGIVLVIVEAIVKQVILYGDEILSTAQDVYRIIQNATSYDSTRESVDALQDFLDKNSTCGYQLKRLTDYVIYFVHHARQVNPNITTNHLRVKISQSSLVLKEIPLATNNCMHELLAYKSRNAAFKTRDLLRKTMGVIVDQLVQRSHTDMGVHVARAQYVLETTNLALTMLGGLDPTRIVWLASQYVQPTCGPTSFIGEIDDGSVYDALGLTIVGEAFMGSYGTWKKKGHGNVTLVLTSIDVEKVTVVIHSGGTSLAKVFVKAGETVTWRSSVKELGGKTLYLDRWRPGLLGLPGTGGGSLKLWVPVAFQGGQLTLHVLINVS
ncbi:hypothetical protein PsorP6_008316 [Peronosclerospora sorghi]|uniref:Uncharacterized protein n=1 Tax=Peronosclerospora sorghi TaxID=230839 RepID=A0ACC0W8F0_9STRA|nr:hypothetical protein PsorP6_008316 [Peronosclerospora sorghi]